MVYWHGGGGESDDGLVPPPPTHYYPLLIALGEQRWACAGVHFDRFAPRWDEWYGPL
jgi:hypothetical protein